MTAAGEAPVARPAPPRASMTMPGPAAAFSGILAACLS